MGPRESRETPNFRQLELPETMAPAPASQTGKDILTAHVRQDDYFRPELKGPSVMQLR
jgi:hypothetical protein